jgi:MFS family permease
LQTAAEAIGMLYVGRLFAGFGIGILVEIVPQFQAEISNASIRGIITSLQQAMLGVGALAANWIGYGCFTRWQNTGISAVEDTVSLVTDQNHIVALLTNGQFRVTNGPRNWTRSLYLSFPRVSKMAG